MIWDELQPSHLSQAAIAQTSSQLDLPELVIHQLLATPSFELHHRYDQARSGVLTHGLPMGFVAVDRVVGEVYYLTSWDARELVSSESEQDIKQHPTYRQYLALSKEGSRPPYIWVNQTWDRTANLSLNRRRLLVAQELGIAIEGWYSTVNPLTGLSLKLEDVHAIYHAVAIGTAADPSQLTAEAHELVNDPKAVGYLSLAQDDDQLPALLSRAHELERDRSSLSVDEANDVLAEFMAQHQGLRGGGIRIAATSEELFQTGLYPVPPRLKAAWEYEHDELLVVCSAHGDSEELKKTLQSELWVHAGLGVLDSDERRVLLQNVIQAFGQNPILTDKWNEVLATHPAKSIWAQAEEVFSLYAEQAREDWSHGEDVTATVNEVDELETFEEWFDGSTVVQKDGSPLVVFKGMASYNWESGEEITTFDSANGPWAGFFTDNSEVADQFARAYSGFGPAATYPVYLSMKAPYIVDAAGQKARDLEVNLSATNDAAVRSRITQIFSDPSFNHYDGVIIRNTEDEGDVYIPRHNDQIQTAIRLEESPALFSRTGADTSDVMLDRGAVIELAIDTVGEATVRNRFVFTDYAGLPATIRETAEKQGAFPDDVRAVHWRGQTFLVDNRFATEEAVVAAIFHEHYTHFGLRTQYGDDLRARLAELLEGIGGLKGLNALAIENNIDLTAYAKGLLPGGGGSKDGPLMLMEELMAHLSETTGTLRRFVQESVGAVRSWLRDNGYAKLTRLGVTDLAYELKRARQAALADTGEISIQGEPCFMFAGGSARKADTNELGKAIQMHQKGFTSIATFHETGWFKGADGQWRFEIDDSLAAFRGGTGENDFDASDVDTDVTHRLGQVLDHRELYRAYPFLTDITVVFKEDMGGKWTGLYDRYKQEIQVLKGSENEMLSILLHEVQHAVQEYEGFAPGGSDDRAFTTSVKRALERMVERDEGYVTAWQRDNQDLLADAELASEVARNALKFDSVQRLIEYANRDKPSGVFRLIRNEMQWIHAAEFQGSDEARELRYRFSDLPKRGPKRNEFLRLMAFDAAMLFKDSIPADQYQRFKNDPRSRRALLAAMDRERARKHEALAPLKQFETSAKVSSSLREASQYKSPFEIYRSLAGEIEARTTEARQHLSADERRTRHPRLDMDVDPSEAIVVVGGREVRAPVAMSAQTQITATPIPQIQSIRSEQIKSATGNSGTFNPSNLDVRHSKADSNDKLMLFQGSPHKFDRFATAAIGTGEGSQSYGWGLYFASEREVAEYYRTMINPRLAELSNVTVTSDPVGWGAWLLFSDDDSIKDMAKEAILEAPEMFDLPITGDQLLEQSEALLSEIRHDGYVYQVHAPNDEVYLLWDESLSQQPPVVQEAWRVVLAEHQQHTGVSERDMEKEFGEARGSQIYELLASRRGAEGASLELLARGVRGVRYLDGISRTYGSGTYNYVIFDERDIEVVSGLEETSAVSDAGAGRHTASSIRDAMDEAFPGVASALEDKNQLRIITSEELPPAIVDGRYSVQAYHGTPYRFDRFDVGAIGTGEGAQAYGHGLYFAGDKAVAQWYREVFQRNLNKGFSRPTFEVRRDTVEPSHWVVDRYFVTPDGIEESFGTTLFESREAAIESVSDQLDGYEESPLSDGGIEFIPKASLYQVKLPSEDAYLQWDVRMSEQPASIREALMPLMQDEVDRRNAAREHLNTLNPGRLSHPVIGPLARKVVSFDDLSGKDVYEALSASARSSVMASEQLQRMGIPGIRYLDDRSRQSVPPKVLEEKGGYTVYWGNDPKPVDTFETHEQALAAAKELDTRTYNYVVFDDSLIEIEDVLHSKDGRVQAYVYNGVVTVVADNVSHATSVKGLLLHEIGVHLMHAARTEEQWSDLLAQFESMAAEPGSRAEAAMDRVPEDTPEHLRTEEGVGYFCEMNPELPFTRQVVGWVRDRIRTWAGESDWLAATPLGRWANTLSEDDLVYMAMAGVRKARKDALTSTVDGLDGVQYSYSDEESTTSAFWKEWREHVTLRNRPGRGQAALAQWLSENYTERNSKHLRMGEFVGGRIGTGEEVLRFRETLAGFDGYHTYGRSITSDKGASGYIFFVVPDELIDRPMAGYSIKELGDRALITVTAMERGPGKYELGVSAPVDGGLALRAAQERGSVEDTGRVSHEGDRYYRLRIGSALTKSFLTEAVRRLTINTGVVPSRITYSGRDTGARSGSASARVFDQRLITTRFSFAGEQAQTADQYTLGRAKELLSKGAEPERVRRDTGWFMGSDQKWRFEIADDEARLIESPFTKSWDEHFSSLERERYGSRGPGISGMPVKELRAYVKWKNALHIEYLRRNKWRPLGEVLHHPKLFAAYPDLAERPVAFPTYMNSRGAYNERFDHIRVMVSSEEAMLSTLLHEVQHAIQSREEFARGGDAKEEFTDTVRSEVSQLSTEAQDEVVKWRADNHELVEASERADEALRHALIYDSATRLLEHSERDQPSRVLRLIRNELQWLYLPGFTSMDEARELQREWHDMPGRHKLTERNVFLKEFTVRASRLLLSSIPEEQRQLFLEDKRTQRSLVAAYKRDADRKQAALAPLRQLENQVRATRHLNSTIRHMVPYGIYRALYGEVEARNVQMRQAFTEEERRARSPLLTQDVPANEVIVMFGGMDVHAPAGLCASDSSSEQLRHTPSSQFGYAEDRSIDSAVAPVLSTLVGRETPFPPEPTNVETRIDLPQTQTPAFREWFGNSQVVDDEGQPLVVYHGTRPGNNITEFHVPSSYDGIYFTPDVVYAESFTINLFGDDQDAGAIYPAYLSIQNPYIVKTTDGSDDFYHFVYRGLDREELEAQGYDGAILIVEGIGIDQVMAFRSVQVKSAIGNTGAFDPANPDIRKSFAGVNARTADTHALADAKTMTEDGFSTEEVLTATGWHHGADDSWRFEINDSEAIIKRPFPSKGQFWGDIIDRIRAHRNVVEQPIVLEELLNHPALFAAYPELRELQVTDEPGRGGSYAASDAAHGPARVAIGREVVMSDALSIVLHETQHAIQHLEGFAQGGSLSPDDWGESVEQDPYWRLAGEVEARNTQARQHLTDRQRRQALPEQTADVPRERIIVLRNGRVVGDGPPPANAFVAGKVGLGKGHTVRSLSKAIDAAFPNVEGYSGVLQSTGRVRLITSDEIPLHVASNQKLVGDDVSQLFSKRRKVQGYVTADGMIHLVADHIDRDESVKGLLLHEIGVHALLMGRSEDQFQAILRRVESMRDSGHPIVMEAYDRVPKSTPETLVAEEALGYLVQHHPDLGPSQRAIAWFRNACRRLGDALPMIQKLGIVQWANDLTTDDLVHMATRATRQAHRLLRQSEPELDPRGLIEPNAREYFPLYSAADSKQPSVAQFWKEWKSHGTFRDDEGNTRKAVKAWLEENLTAHERGVRGRGRLLSGSIGSGRELIHFGERVAGFEGYVTVARTVSDDVFAFYVVPTDLLNSVGKKDTSNYGSAAICTITLTRTQGNQFEAGVSGPLDGGIAHHHLEGSEYLADTGIANRDGDRYLRLKVGTALTRSWMSEAVRRLTLSIGQVPDSLMYSSRDTGARAGSKVGREVNRDFIEAKFSVSGTENPVSFDNATRNTIRSWLHIDEREGDPESLTRIVASLAERVSRGESPAERHLRKEFTFHNKVSLGADAIEQLAANIDSMPDALEGKHAKAIIYHHIPDDDVQALKSSSLGTWIHGNRDLNISREALRELVAKVVGELKINGPSPGM